MLRLLHPADVAWDLERAGTAEAKRDARWAFVGHKGPPRWRWHASDHHPGTVLASVCGRRTDAAFVRCKALLESCGLTRSDTDCWGASTRHLAPDEPCPGQRHTQTIKRTHRTVRPRMKRLAGKTIGFSQTTQMHDIVLGVLVNRDACGRAVSTGPSPLLHHDPRPEASMECAFSGSLPRCRMLCYACS